MKNISTENVSVKVCTKTEVLKRKSKYYLASSKRLLVITLLISINLIHSSKLFSQSYDFYGAVPSGQTLYFKMVDATNLTVAVVNQLGLTNDCGYINPPTGNLVIPSQITVTNGISYTIVAIDSSAFEECFGLTSVSIPNTCTQIAYSAFFGCIGLSGSLTIPNSVTVIDAYAFGYCQNLTSVTIGNSVLAIANYAFAECTSLTSVTIGNSVRTIGDYNFSGISGLSTVNFNADSCLRFYGNNPDNAAFSGCGVKTINIGENVKAIPECSFIFCDSLQSITVPNNVKYLGAFSFYSCERLSNVSIGDSINIIDEYSFYECSKLSNLTLGRSVTNINESAFSSCHNIDTIISYSTIAPILGMYVFNDISNTANVFIPCGSTMSYMSRWNMFNSFMDIDPLFFSATSEELEKGSVIIMTEPTCSSPTAVVYAQPNTGYIFDRWSNGETTNPYSLTLEGDSSLVAYFISEAYTITVMSANNSMGTVSGSGEYEQGAEAILIATPNEGYRFVRWNDGNTDNPRTITVIEDATYIATFEERVGIESRDMLSELTFHPNPTSGIISFNHNDIKKVEVLDEMGRMIAVYENAYTIDISKLTKGYYVMRVTTSEGVVIRKVVRK